LTIAFDYRAFIDAHNQSLKIDYRTTRLLH